MANPAGAGVFKFSKQEVQSKGDSGGKQGRDFAAVGQRWKALLNYSPGSNTLHQRLSLCAVFSDYVEIQRLGRFHFHRQTHQQAHRPCLVFFLLVVTFVIASLRSFVDACLY